jgi:DNA-binding CsgD family transcriptional regulator
MKSQSGAESPGAELADGVLDVVSRNPLPALILAVPSERIVAASPAALDLLSPPDGELIGRNFEWFTADDPSGALELLISGRLNGYERVRHLRLSDGSPAPFQTWVRTIGEQVPVRHVLVVLTTDVMPTGSAGFSVPMELNALIGTTDVDLRIDRVHSDVDTVVGNLPAELIGQTLFGVVRPDDLAGLMWALAQSTSTGKGVSLHVHVNNDGEQAQLWQMLLLPVDPTPGFAFTLISVGRSEGLPGWDTEQPLGQTRGMDVLDISRRLADLTEAEVPGILELSSREFDVVTRLLAGYRVPAIAGALFISQSTVRNHLSSVFRKLRVESQQELIDLLAFRKDEMSNGK